MLAAREVLLGMNLWNELQSKMIIGQNIAQTYQFVESGSAELGFVAFAQLKSRGWVFKRIVC